MKPLLWILVPLLCLPGAACAQEELINGDTQKAIDGGLALLAKEQNKDGSFGTGQYTGNLGVTGLVGVAFLVRKRDAKDDAYDKVVENALRFTLSKQDENGFFANRRATLHGPMYSHGFAVLFLAEAHDSVKDAKLKAEVKAALERSVKIIIESQNKEGGWRYQPRPADADLSVSACQIVVLRAARDVGVGVPKRTVDQAAEYIKRCQDKDSGGFRYQPLGGMPSYGRTAAALTCLNRLGIPADESTRKATDYLRKAGKQYAPDIHASISHYYSAKAMWYAGDKEWREWYPTLRAECLKSRKVDNRFSNGQLCSHYTTAMALIVLQMPHQALPSLKR